MTEYMSLEDYDEFLRLQENFEQCLVDCAQEISMILKGRKLIGSWDCCAELYDNKYFVTFEQYSCGDTDTDSVNVPMEFIYDKEYRIQHRMYLIERREEKERERLEYEEARKTRYRVITENDERSEYERLKLIYGDK